METFYLYLNSKISSLWRESKGIMVVVFFLLIHPILISSQQDSLLQRNESTLIVSVDKKELVFVSGAVKICGLEENSNSIIVHLENKSGLEKNVDKKLKTLNRLQQKHKKKEILNKKLVHNNIFIFKPREKNEFLDLCNSSIQQLYFPQTQDKNSIKILFWDIYRVAFFEKSGNIKTRNRSLLLIHFNFTYSSRPPPMIC
ncbi:hypothetical protein [Chryseobacterium arthrosphaerae]|uniref:hypothetical protein n=1 Tax=Chryseobacterium arthrosphaerae TaxID=651561 RepID=UPI001E4626D7|nr:hypothetical protein [Chryseobacterium arthrosphaerae]UEQ78329.1 hypothetical protein J8N07_08545 [Chryseobacterium arthrosphaerae]